MTRSTRCELSIQTSTRFLNWFRNKLKIIQSAKLNLDQINNNRVNKINSEMSRLIFKQFREFVWLSKHNLNQEKWRTLLKQKESKRFNKLLRRRSFYAESIFLYSSTTREETLKTSTQCLLSAAHWVNAHWAPLLNEGEKAELRKKARNCKEMRKNK